MTATHHTELEAWKLADEVRTAFREVIDRDRVRRDFDFCNQTRSAARSACRNVAEGFYRFGHPEFAHFVNIAIGSLGELRDSAHEALQSRYVDQAEHAALQDRIDRALGASIELHQHLISTPTPPRRKRR